MRAMHHTHRILLTASILFAASAAHVFQTITNGLGAMPSYATMIPPEDRWKIVAYLRAMQLSRRVNANELPADERGRIGAQQPGGTQPAHGGEQH